MFYKIVGILIFLLLIVLVGFIMKKKYYKENDRLEDWKITIMNRPVNDELSKIKQLNMTGEAEKLFEKWRQQWDEIIMVQLPDVEEDFLDAEHYIDKYSFKKAKNSQSKIADKLKEADEKINLILEELDNLIGSEEKSRKDISSLKDSYREARKVLLARSHSFGLAANNLETELDKVVELFELFEQNTAEGNYLDAREIVFQIRDLLAMTKIKMDLIPQLLIECTTTIPSQLKQLTDGYKEMVQSGYILTHIQMERELERLNKQLSTYKSFVEKTEIADVESGLEEIKDSIDLLFDLLEKEVNAKHFITKNLHDVSEKIGQSELKNDQLETETKIVQQAYQLSTKDINAYEQISNELIQLIKRFEVLEIKVEQEETAFSELETELDNVAQSLNSIIKEQTDLFTLLTTLREDEVIAREKVVKLKSDLKNVIRLVERSNLPGLPKHYEHLFQDAQTSLHTVIESLDENPLNMTLINENLAITVEQVQKLIDETNEIITDVKYVETIIQYGNRYRSRYPNIAEKLKEAETLFHSYDYKEALEQAAAAIEEVEPGSLKKVEQILND